MKNSIISILIYAFLVSGLILSEAYNIAYIGNLVIFTIWFLVICGFICLFADPKTLYKENVKLKKVQTTLQITLIVTTVFFGWFITAIFYSLAYFLVIVKRSVYLDGIKESKEKADQV